MKRANVERFWVGVGATNVSTNEITGAMWSRVTGPSATCTPKWAVTHRAQSEWEMSPCGWT